VVTDPVVEDTYPLMSRRQYLVLTAMEQTGCDVFLAMEAVASTAIENPEINYDERRTFTEWETADESQARPGNASRGTAPAPSVPPVDPPVPVRETGLPGEGRSEKGR
jgi:hypothetical protein